MNIRNWCKSGRETITLGSYYPHDDIKPMRSSSSSSSSSTIISNKLRWKVIWNKYLKREKKIMNAFDYSAPHHQLTYDSYSYSQNFDQGPSWDDEPDSLSRSFSCRFADPSKIFVTKGII